MCQRFDVTENLEKFCKFFLEMNRANNLCTGTPRGIHRAGLTCVSVTPTTRILPPASYYYCTSPATVWYEYVLYGKSAGCLHLGCWPLSWLLRRAAIRRELHRSRHGLRGALIHFVLVREGRRTEPTERVASIGWARLVGTVVGGGRRGLTIPCRIVYIPV
jgi:hypothetical protein